jgi:hypothetical protein
MNAIGGFFAPLNGFLLAGYPAKMRNRQKQETPRTSLGDGPKTLARDRSPAPWSLPRASRSMVPNLDFSPYELVKKIDMARHSPSSRILQHPAPVPCVIAVDRRVWLARAPACLPFVQRDDALPSGMRRIDAAIRRDMRDRLDSRGNLHLRPQDRLRGRNSDFGMPALLPAFDRLVDGISPRSDRAIVKVQRILFPLH